MFDTNRTRVDWTNVALTRRADPKAQIGRDGIQTAKTASKSTSIHAALEPLAIRDELRLIWVRYRWMPDDAKVSKADYGRLLELAKLGTGRNFSCA